MSQFGAVLSGDLVGSSKLSAEKIDAVRDCLMHSVGKILNRESGDLSRDFSMFRGDAWQLFLREPGSSLRVALFVRAMLISDHEIDSRVGIGIGAVSKLDEAQVSLSVGEAFTLSGRALESISKSRREHYLMALGFAGESNQIGHWFHLVVKLCDVIVGGWSQKQARALSLALLGHTQTKIAQELGEGITQQAIARTLDRAHWFAIEEALSAFETNDWAVS